MMQIFTDALIRYPVLTLFLVIGLGYWLGEIRIMGFQLGIAGVLFVGIALGSLDKAIGLPEVVSSFGLIVFVYCIGIHLGPEFSKVFRKRGLSDSLIAILILCVAALIVLLVGDIFSIPGVQIAGTFCGSLTNTPALAAAREMLTESARAAGLSTERVSALAGQPVVAYSIAYPFGVLGVILSFQFYRWLLKAEVPPAEPPARILVVNLRIENPGVVGKTINEVMRHHEHHAFIISRIQHNGDTQIAHGDTVLHQGDILAVVGEESDLTVAVQIFGTESEAGIERDRSQFDYRRIYVSSPEVVGHTVGELSLDERFSAVITRVRRADQDMVATPDVRLEYGDRVRVVSPLERFEQITEFFGDSSKAMAHVDFGAMAIGMTLGVLLGLIPVNIGGMPVKLGLAGGPLIAALILGKLGRTGKICWTLPMSANLTLRHIGILMFLGAVGTRAGYEFFHTLRESGFALLIAGALVTFLTVSLTILVAYKWMKLPYDYVMGMISGIFTQPAALVFANQHSNTDNPDLGWTSVYAAATIAKIVFAQVVLMQAGGLIFQ